MTRSVGLLLFASLIAAGSLGFFVSSYHLFQLTQFLVYAIALLGLNLLTGYSGQISLGHGAFYGLGAYATAIFLARGWLPYWAAVPSAGVVCLVVGFAFGLPALRLEGPYLALATFALAIATPQILKHDRLESWTGGVQGLYLEKPSPPHLLGEWLTADRWLYWLCLASVLAFYIVGLNLVRGRTGRALVALRDHPIAAAAMGIDVARYRSSAFAVSALFTGVAGALGALLTGFISPDSFTVFTSIDFLVGIVVGGIASVFGNFVGAAFIVLAPNLLGEISDAAPSAAYGLVLILFMILFPSGIAGAWRALAAGRPPKSTRSKAMTRRTTLMSTLIVLASGCQKTASHDAPGITATEIRVGQTMPYSGPASAYGAIGKASAAYFRMINDQGGVGGRKINLISLDDGYSPPKTVEQIRRLVEKDEVAFIFNVVGTAPNSAIQKYLNEKGIPQLFVATGADKWSDYKNFRWTMSWQPSYRVEARVYGKYINENKPDAHICVLYQNDDFGKDYLLGLQDALGPSYAEKVRKTASYETTDPSVDSQVVDLKASGCDTLVTAATPKFAAQAIRKVHDIGWTPLHFMTNVSISIGAVMQPAGPEKGVGIVSGAYLKDPGDPAFQNDPAVVQWHGFMQKYLPSADAADGNYVYGYAVSETLVQVLTQCGSDLSRENILRQATSLRGFKPSLALPGLELNTSPTDYRPFSQMQLARFNGRNFERFGPVINGE